MFKQLLLYVCMSHLGAELCTNLKSLVLSLTYSFCPVLESLSALDLISIISTQLSMSLELIFSPSASSPADRPVRHDPLRDQRAAGEAGFLQEGHGSGWGAGGVPLLPCQRQPVQGGEGVQVLHFHSCHGELLPRAQSRSPAHRPITRQGCRNVGISLHLSAPKLLQDRLVIACDEISFQSKTSWSWMSLLSIRARPSERSTVWICTYRSRGLFSQQ